MRRLALKFLPHNNAYILKLFAKFQYYLIYIDWEIWVGILDREKKSNSRLCIGSHGTGTVTWKSFPVVNSRVPWKLTVKSQFRIHSNLVYAVQIQQEVYYFYFKCFFNRGHLFIISGRNYYFEDEVFARIDEQLLRIKICCNKYCNPERRYEVLRRNILLKYLIKLSSFYYILFYIYIIERYLSSIYISIYLSIYLSTINIYIAISA